MTDDMGCDLEFPDVGELTFPQWRDWLAQYNKFIGERDVRYAAGLRERDDRIKNLETALREIAQNDYGLQGMIEDGTDTPEAKAKYYAGQVDWRRRLARKALEAKDD